MEFTLLAAALTAAAALWLGIRYQLGRHPYDHAEKPFDVLIGAAGVGVFAGRLAAMVASGVNPIARPFDVLLVRAGVDTVVASIAGIVVVGWVYRSDIAALDILAPAALLGLAGWHAGCVWTGSCLGAATGSEFGLRLPGSTIARHPTEIYAAVALVASAYAISRLQRPFMALGLSLAAAGGIRAATQPIRPSLTGGPMWAYLVATAAGLVLTIWAATRTTS
jgi:hypothetical protein